MLVFPPPDCEVVETEVSMPKAILTKVDEMGRDLLLDFFV